MHEEEVTIRVQVPDGYELTREYLTEYRDRLALGWSTRTNEPIVIPCMSYYSGPPRLILRKKWTPPDWIPDGAVIDKCDGWNDEYEIRSNGVVSKAVSVLAKFYGGEFTPPPVLPYTVKRS